ncbi:hypothetical protein BaRGS_00005886 [Batillaria attramentaria]|uniref:Uncharacterized protein n=1 Tax=Batillaria attramentaria TaxID=370345 RepID=A0ABD0LTY0_9CAEN
MMKNTSPYLTLTRHAPGIRYLEPFYPPLTTHANGSVGPNETTPPGRNCRLPSGSGWVKARQPLPGCTVRLPRVRAVEKKGRGVRTQPLLRVPCITDGDIYTCDLPVRHIMPRLFRHSDSAMLDCFHIHVGAHAHAALPHFERCTGKTRGYESRTETKTCLSVHDTTL